MTNLTDKWKKGELPDGWYYVKDKRDIIRIDYFADVWDYTDIDEVNEVLAEVPSYEQWKSSDKLILTLMDNIKEKSDLLQRAMEKNTELKELLKECRENIAAIDYDSSVLDREQSILLNKINQVLGEE